MQNHILGGPGNGPPGKGLQQLRLRYMSISASRAVGTSSLPAGKAHFKCLWLFAPWSPVIIFSFPSELLSRGFGSADVLGCSSRWSRRCFSVGRGWIFREAERLNYTSVSQSLCNALQGEWAAWDFLNRHKGLCPVHLLQCRGQLITGLHKSCKYRQVWGPSPPQCCTEVQEA